MLFVLVTRAKEDTEDIVAISSNSWGCLKLKCVHFWFFFPYHSESATNVVKKGSTSDTDIHMLT